MQRANRERNFNNTHRLKVGCVMRYSTVPWNAGLKRSAVGVEVPSCEASWMLTAVNVWSTQGQSNKLGSLRPRIY